MDNITPLTTVSVILPPPVSDEQESIKTAIEELHPVTAAERIKTIDVIRGVALLGILLMNIPGFGISWGHMFATFRGPHDADYYTNAVISTFFEGTMRGLFSMLFGAGMILFTMNKIERPGGVTVAELYYRRLLWLVLFGVINAYVLLWFGDILFFYGLCGMVLYPFRKTAAKWLFFLGFLLMASGMLKQAIGYNETRQQRKDYLAAVAVQKSGKKLNAEQQQAIENWSRIERRGPDPAYNAYNVSQMRSDYGTVFTYMIQRNSSMEAWGMSQWGFYDCIGIMLIGMALFRLGFFSNRLSTGNYALGLLVGYGIGIPISYLMFSKGLMTSVSSGAYVDRYSMDHYLLYDIKRVFLSLGHASLVMLVFRSRIVPWLMKALANVGQMAFTNYLMQSVICTLFFYGYGLAFYDKLKFHELYYVVAGVWVFQIIFSVIWLHYFRFGPLEWLWRSLTYWKKQPMSKSEQRLMQQETANTQVIIH